LHIDHKFCPTVIIIVVTINCNVTDHSDRELEEICELIVLMERNALNEILTLS
jgi:hypothetical protein